MSDQKIKQNDKVVEETSMETPQEDSSTKVVNKENPSDKASSENSNMTNNEVSPATNDTKNAKDEKSGTTAENTSDNDTDVTNEEDDAGIDERGVGSRKIKGHTVITKSDDEASLWYVVHTTSGHEARVSETLRQRVETMRLEETVHEILVPTQDRVVIRGGKKATIKEKIFPGYMLVKMIITDETWLAVRTTPGITGFVGAGNKPTALSGAEVANIQKFVSTPAKRFKTKFTTGEAVKINDGPFSDFLGTIQEIDEEKGKVSILVSIFGRETPVELDLLQITKV